ncbi:PH domain-containing protein [Pseudoxanthomonas beigongshangi]
MARDFTVAPLDRWTLLGLWLPMTSAMAIAAGSVFWNSSEQVPRGLLFTLPFVLLVGVALHMLLRRRRIRLEHGELHITATMFQKRFPVSAIDLDKARIIDLDEHTEFKPRVKTNGFSLPAFTAGHYRLRNKAKAFCLISDRARVLVLPLREGPLVLLSPEKPRELLDGLREVAASAPQR